MTAAVLDTKIRELKNKIPVVRDLVKNTDYEPKILEIK